MITTDYTVRDTLKGAPFSRYRFSCWLTDILRNFIADPVNLRDGRLAKVMARAQAADPDYEIVRVDTPYSQDSRKACATPAVLVSSGACDYPLHTANVLSCGQAASGGACRAYGNSVLRRIAASVAVLTESCAGTELLAGTIEDFFVTNAVQLGRDGMVSGFTVTGSSEPRHISLGEAGNAKDLYQIVVGVQASGGISWETDTQGPVFRGLSRAGGTA